MNGGIATEGGDWIEMDAGFVFGGERVEGLERGKKGVGRGHLRMGVEYGLRFGLSREGILRIFQRVCFGTSH